MPSPKRPHIVIFNPDQWRGDVLGHMGNPGAVTPNLDRFVEEDHVSFRHAYCQNPVCTPSRCSFMTGWYTHVRGHRTMFHMLHPERGEPNLLKTLKDEGYFVWWGGKNDLVPRQDGFEDYCDVKFQPTDEDFKRWGHTPRAMSAKDRGEDWRGEPGSDTYYSFLVGKLDTEGDDIFCDGDWQNVLGAIDQIKNAPEDQPMCLYLPLAYPHPQYAVEEPYYSQVDPEKIPDRVPTPEEWAGLPSILKQLVKNFGMESWTEDRWRELRRVYYAMCARVDHQYSLLVQALKDAGMYDDTAIFFFSDHGDFTGDYGLVEKTQNTFEDCLTRVPFLIKPPKGHDVQPRVSEAMVELVDFSATVFDLLDIDPGYTSFGRSLLPAVAGETDEHRDAVFCEGGRYKGEEQAMEKQSGSQGDPSVHHYWPRMQVQRTDEQPFHTKAIMCRTKDFKYVRRLYETDEFYDLRNDPGELRNRILDPELSPQIAWHKDRLLTHFLETGDVVPMEEDQR